MVGVWPTADMGSSASAAHLYVTIEKGTLEILANKNTIATASTINEDSTAFSGQFEGMLSRIFYVRTIPASMPWACTPP